MNKAPEHSTDSNVVSETQFGPLTDHTYDGIREYDNPLPAWWTWLFIGTVVFSVLYFPYYHGGAEGRTLADSYTSAVAENARMMFGQIGELKGDQDTILTYMQKSSWVGLGQSTFKTNCVACHGSEGGGLVGPNLCDDNYKNVRNVEDLYNIIANGAAAGAMPAWKGRLQQNELVLTAAYVATLRGKTPAKAKDPEGQKIAPWPDPPPEEPAATDKKDEAAAK